MQSQWSRPFRGMESNHHLRRLCKRIHLSSRSRFFETRIRTCSETIWKIRWIIQWWAILFRRHGRKILGIGEGRNVVKLRKFENILWMRVCEMPATMRGLGFLWWPNHTGREGIVKSTPSYSRQMMVEGEEISEAHSWFFVGYAKSWTKWILIKGKSAANTLKKAKSTWYVFKKWQKSLVGWW